VIRSRLVRDGAALGAVAVLAIGCSSPPGPAGASPGQTPASPGTENPANGPNPPAGDGVRIDSASISDDGTAITVQFVGGKDYVPGDPCSHHYFGWANETDGVLEVKVVDDTPQAPLQEGTACDALGYGRTVTIELDRAFGGSRVHDAAGYVHFVRPPEGLADITVPAGWTLATQSDVQESPTGRWQRTWTMGGAANPATSKGKIDLYQAFGGPAGVTGGDEVRQVQVNGAPATLYRSAPDGELVLVWMVDSDGMALVVNETEFPVEKAIELAEGLTLP
jgi:hypothetical protein